MAINVPIRTYKRYLRAVIALKDILSALPSNKDWLDPDLEKEIRQIINELRETKHGHKPNV